LKQLHQTQPNIVYLDASSVFTCKGKGNGKHGIL